MLVHIENILSAITVMIVMMLIARYVFLEPVWKKGQRIFYGISIGVIIFCEFAVPSDEGSLIFLLCVSFYLAAARKKRRIRGFFLIIPIFGICLGFMMPLLYLPAILFTWNVQQSEIYYRIVDSLSFALLLLFAWKGKAWRQEFEKELQFRSLEKWERRLLNLIGVLFWVLSWPFPMNENMTSLSFSEKFYLAVINITCLIMAVMLVSLVLRGNKSAYYHGIAQLNERYLVAEMKHFQAYQNTQIETRRIRHDMKNHMTSLMYLAQEGKLEEIKKYLRDIGAEVEQLDKELHSGNALVDAIINERNQDAGQKNIRFRVEGRLPENLKVQPVDLCTIFANALDNCLDALVNVTEEKRWMKLSISVQGKIIFLKFSNSMQDGGLHNLGSVTTKQDKVNHGFGLRNIKMAVEKYQGEMRITQEMQGEQRVFVLELMLMDGIF